MSVKIRKLIAFTKQILSSLYNVVDTMVSIVIGIYGI